MIIGTWLLSCSPTLQPLLCGVLVQAARGMLRLHGGLTKSVMFDELRFGGLTCKLVVMGVAQQELNAAVAAMERR